MEHDWIGTSFSRAFFGGLSLLRGDFWGSWLGVNALTDRLTD